MSPIRRTCVGCREVDEPARMRRFSVVGGVLVPDVSGGRGAWVHPSRDCLLAARRRKGFARSLRCQVDDGVLDRLIAESAT